MTLHVPAPRRLSPFPPPGSPELVQLHQQLLDALARREELKLSKQQRLLMAQTLRIAAVTLDP